MCDPSFVGGDKDRNAGREGAMCSYGGVVMPTRSGNVARRGGTHGRRQQGEDKQILVGISYIRDQLEIFYRNHDGMKEVEAALRVPPCPIGRYVCDSGPLSPTASSMDDGHYYSLTAASSVHLTFFGAPCENKTRNYARKKPA